MKYVSLFSGVGGFDLALNRMGFECVLASEIDKYANKAYKILYEHDTAGDVTKIRAEDVPDHDLLTAGFPCQSFSIAGKRKGFEDTRGTLFFDVARIVAVKQPRFLLLENVKGLLSHDKGRTLEIMLQTLSDIGYTIDFTILNSKFYYVPQNRERLFIVGLLDGPKETFNIHGSNVLAKSKRKVNQMGIKTFNFPFPTSQDVTTKLSDILETNPDEKYYLAEEKTRKFIDQLKVKYESNDGTILDSKNTFGATRVYQELAPAVLANDYKEPKKVLEPRINVIGELDMKGSESVRRVEDPSGLSPTLTTMGGGHREPKILTQQVSNGDGISYCVDANYSKGISDLNKARRTHILETLSLTERRTEESKKLRKEYRKKFGTDYDPRRGKKLVPRDDDMSNCLTASHSLEHLILEKPQYRIRKLTPLECFRLQGFPDEYYQKLKSAKISDTQLYKMAGNAVTVNVVEAIVSELIKYKELSKKGAQ